MRTRYKKYSDYGLTNDDIQSVMQYCSSDEADTDMIMSCAIMANDALAGYLYESVVNRASYGSMYFVPITKTDFYAYRRKMIAIICKCMRENGIL